MDFLKEKFFFEKFKNSDFFKKNLNWTKLLWFRTATFKSYNFARFCPTLYKILCTFLLLNRMQPIKISMNLWHLFPFSIFSLLSHFSGLIFTCKAFNISQQKTVFCLKYNTIYNLLYHNSCFSLFLLKYTEKTEKCLWGGKKIQPMEMLKNYLFKWTL